MLPQKPSPKSQYVKPKRKTRKRAHAHLFSEPNPTSSLPSLLFPSLITLCLPLFEQLTVAGAGASFAFYETITSRIRSPKNKNKNKTKQKTNSNQVASSWAEQRAANSNLTPSGQAVGQVGQLDSLPIADYCNVVVWHAGQRAAAAANAQATRTVGWVTLSHPTNACLRILLM